MIERRRQDYTRDVTHAFVGFVAGFVCAGLVACASATPTITPAEAIDLGDTGAKITHCQLVGRQTKSYHAYECCMIESGLTPGAKCSPAATISPTDAGKDVNSGD
jgi:hypothetical protein